jgi:leucyl aminopeptidase (aminopeptidase T)
MHLIERYGSSPNRIMSLVPAWQVPFRNIRKGDRILVATDDTMDPLVWQSAMTALNDRGAECVVTMYPRLSYHDADPPSIVVEAMKHADAVLALTSTALNSGTPALRAVRDVGGAATGKTPTWLMEEMTVEILTEGGGRSTVEDLEEICALGGRIGELYDRAKRIHVLSKLGTDLTADISGYPAGYHTKRRTELPFDRKESGKLGGGTWPFGEVHVEPLPGSANGTIVWDVTAHHPSGRWREPVTLQVKDGKVVDIAGGHEADQVRWYLETYGDENSYLLGGEISIGTNKQCWPAMGLMRNDKKRYGAMHLGIGHGADRGQILSTLRLEGIIDKVTVVVDDDVVVCQDGKILV